MKYDLNKLNKQISYSLILVFVLTGCSLANSPWTHYPLEDDTIVIAWNIEEDFNGDIWVGGSSSAMPVFNPTTESFFYKHLPESIPQPQEIILGREGDMWIGTREGMIRYRFQQDTGLFSIGETVLANQDIRSILQDTQGILWVGTVTDGLYQSRDDGLTWQAVSVDRQKELGFVYDVYEDNQNNIWVSSAAGIYTNDKISGKWSRFNQPKLLDRQIVDTVFEDSRGFLWFGTRGGLVRYDPLNNLWHTFTTENVFPDKYILAIAEDKTGDLWFGSSDGATRFSAGSGEWINFNEEDGYIDAQVMDILFDRDGNVWFATFGDGLFKYEVN
jgi:ligand-binding sensor domain-containing protein